jgi:hypothetical protein
VAYSSAGGEAAAYEVGPTTLDPQIGIRKIIVFTICLIQSFKGPQKNLLFFKGPKSPCEIIDSSARARPRDRGRRP